MSVKSEKFEKISGEEEELPMIEYDSQHIASADGSSKEDESRESITFKVCNRVKIANAESTVCGCGREISDHDPSIAKKAEVGEWKSEVDTIRKTGNIKNVLFRLNETVGNSTKCPWYVRVSDDIPTEIAVAEIESDNLFEWNPFLISFLGGCGNEFVTKHTEDILKDAISKFMSSFNCTFFTRASHTGLAKVVAQICRSCMQSDTHMSYSVESHYKSTCIGFIPWGCVRERKSLELEESESFAKYDFNISNIEEEEKSHFLDHNHHLFVLVDDGSINKYGSEIKLRSHIQQYLVVKSGKPCVNLLYGGGLTSMKSIYADLFPNLEDPENALVIPVVVLKNSGKAADVLSCVLECDKIEQQSRKWKRYRRINLMLATKCAANKYLQLDLEVVANLRTIQIVRECVELRKDKIFICDVEKQSSNLYDVILTAALQVSSIEGNHPYLSSKMQFQLAIALQDAELARKIIQEDKNVAIELLTEFVEEYDVKAIENLFETIEFDVGVFWKIVTRTYDFELLLATSTVIKAANQRFPYLTNENLTPGIFLGSLGEDKDYDYNKQVINVTQAVMIYFIMIERPPLAKVFWKYDKHNPLSNAILAFQLQSSIIGFYKTIVPSNLKESIAYFKEKIVQLLTCYYEVCKDDAPYAVSRKIPMWRNQSLIDVAGDLELKFFIEQPACQIVLSKVWSGQDMEREQYLRNIRKKSQRTNLVCLGYFLCYVINKYLGKPATKLFLHVLMYLLSVGIFSLYLLVKGSPAHEAIKWTMFAMVSAVALDEFRQVVEPRKSVRLNIKRWASSPWNLLDLACILLFYAGFTANFFHQQLSLSVFSIFFFIWCTKLAQFLRTSSSLGPYMVMIFEMLKNTKTFFGFLFVAIIGYGVFMTALLFPNSKASWDTLFKVFFRPYLLVFGEMGLESHELGSSKTVFGTPKVSRHAEILVILGMALFLMLANVVLLNLLIAVFSNIYEEVKARSYQIWKFEQYELLQEFKKKPLLPFPFSVFENVYLLCRRLCSQQPNESIDAFGQRHKNDDFDAERISMVKLWSDLSKKDVTQRKYFDVLAELEKSNLNINERMNKIAKDVKVQKEQLRKRFMQVSCSIDANTEKVLKKNEETNQRIAHLEEMILNLRSESGFNKQE